MTQEAVVDSTVMYRFVIESQQEGVYVYGFRYQTSRIPEFDWLQESEIAAKEFCEEDFGVPSCAWREIPRCGWHDSK